MCNRSRRLETERGTVGKLAVLRVKDFGSK